MKIDIEGYYEPIKILSQYEEFGYSGMTNFELAFLCGAIKYFKPKKIVEVGVAAGGTTTVILECLKLCSVRCDMYSVDVSKKFYCDTTKDTGFVARDYLNSNVTDVNHTFILGGTIASALDQIGTGIDFVILDTMHSLPGELLDFISLYHSLNSNAVIVFHDVAQSHLGVVPFEYASLVTLTTVLGDKCIGVDSSRIGSFANIGLVQLNEDTLKSIENIFLALMINWHYIPDKKSLYEYRMRIEKEWEQKYVEWFDRALENNTYSLYRRKAMTVNPKYVKEKLEEILQIPGDIYIYGAGILGKKVGRYIENLGIKIAGYIVTKKTATQKDEYIVELDELKNTKQIKIILGLDEKYHEEILPMLYEKGLENCVFPYNGIGFREMMFLINQDNLMKDGEKYINSNWYEIGIREASKMEA